MKWYSKILIPLSFIGGLFTMFYMRRPEIGDKVTVNAKIKTKKSIGTESNLRTQYTEVDFDKTKKRRKLPLLNRFKSRKKRNNEN